MAWIKQNMILVAGAVLALALIGFAGFCTFSGYKESGKPMTSNAESRDVNLNVALDKAETPVVAARGASEIAKLTLRCRAVIPSHVSSGAETTIAYALQKELHESTDLFDPQTTKLGPEIHRERNADTVSFDVNLGLRRPIKL